MGLNMSSGPPSTPFRIIRILVGLWIEPAGWSEVREEGEAE